MELTLEEMREVCVAHYVERGHTPDHADLIVPHDKEEILRIHARIQEETEMVKRCKQIPRPVAGLNIIEIVEADEEATAEGAVVSIPSRSEGEREQKIFGQTPITNLEPF